MTTTPHTSTPPGSPERYHIVGHMPLSYRPWFPIAVAAGLAGLFWLALNIPGVLRYPTQPLPAAVADPGDPRRVAALEEHNRSLREQIERARRLAARDVCVKDGALYERPPTRTGAVPSSGPAGGPVAANPIPGTGNPAPAAAAPKKISPEDGGDLIPMPPERMPVPPGAVPSFEGNIPDMLDQAVVLVIGPGRGGQSSMGSGFFITNSRIVTNRHVIDAGDGQTYFVTNKLLGGIRPARLVAKSQSGAPGSPDFAVLEIDAPTKAPPVMPLTPAVGRLQRVTAAGFPGIVTASDQKLEALKRGDTNAIPDMVLTQGTVTVVQNREVGAPIVGHEATIAPGNSGGPLIDDCARVVGVNTYGIFDPSGKHKVNYALGAESLIAFLKANNITYRSDAVVCQPPAPRTAAVAPPAAAPPTDPAKAAPPTAPAANPPTPADPQKN